MSLPYCQKPARSHALILPSTVDTNKIQFLCDNVKKTFYYEIGKQIRVLLEIKLKETNFSKIASLSATAYSRAMTISQAIVSLREALGQSQEVFARAVGVSTTTISNWENGKSPAHRHLRMLAGLAVSNSLKHLADFFDASWRAAIVSRTGALSSPGSPRRITLAELNQWQEWLEIVIDGSEAQIRYVDGITDLDSSVRQHLKQVFQFHQQIAGHTLNELQLHIYQPEIRSGKVDWDKLSEQTKAAMLAPPDPEKVRKLNDAYRQAWKRTGYAQEEGESLSKVTSETTSQPREQQKSRAQEEPRAKKRKGRGKSGHSPQPTNRKT